VSVAPALALWLLAFADAGRPAPEAVVLEGETLEAVAKRTLGDERAAGELRALNALAPDAGAALTPGTALKLPGPERALALSALAAGRNAVAQADSNQKSRELAAARLAEAEGLFQAGRYAEAAQAADGAWQLVSARAGEPTRFEVAVDPEGATHVTSHSGKPVRVEGDGVVQQVYAGQEVKVIKGNPPPVPEAVRVAPELVGPVDEARLKQTARGKPVAIDLVWKPVPGAKGYEVQVAQAAATRTLKLKAVKPRATLPSLPAGKYRWTVHALYETGAAGPAPTAWQLELLDEPLLLEVGKTKWK
jgi:hypothetical protein